MLDSSPVFYNLLIWISMSIFLPIFTATLLMSWFSPTGVTFCPYHHLMSFLIIFLLLLIWKYLQTTVTLPQTITYRKLKAINMEAFKADINNSDLIKNTKSNATELAQQYDSVLSTLIDFHAPLATKKTSSKPPNPWMTPSILVSKRHRRYLEWVWRRYPTALNRSRFSKQIHLCNKQMWKAISAHYSKIIAEHSGDHRSLRQAFNKILHRCPKMYLPDHSSITTLANTFSSFFINKISIIRPSFPSGSCSNVLSTPNTREVLHNLSYVTDAEERRLVLSGPCKSSDLDPLPTFLVKDCIDVLDTPIVSIDNLSLSEGCFPDTFQVCPSLPFVEKKPTLNRDDMNNYRPVSNLSFLSEILEVVASRLNSHINSSHTSNDYQSAYREFHSTETALLKIHNDILSSMDDGRVTALTLLDLSAAFDTIDHTILLKRLGNWFGVSGKALDCFKSYLTDRSQRIRLGNCLSSRSDLSFGVPQGSVLCPLLLTLYTTPLSSLVSGHAIPHHLYADDSQLYACVTEWRRFLLALFPSDLVKQIFNDQTSKVQLFTEFITDIFYIHDVSSLWNIRQMTKQTTEVKGTQTQRNDSKKQQ